jgi:hypothetical protein
VSAPDPADRNLAIEVVVLVHVPEAREPFRASAVLTGPLSPQPVAYTAMKAAQKIIDDMREMYRKERP